MDRRWDIARWIAAGHLSVLLGSLLILALVRHGGVSTVASSFAVGVIVATPLALVARLLWKRLQQYSWPTPARAVILGAAGAALGIPAAIVFPIVLAIAGEDISAVSSIIAGGVVGLAGLWCGILIAPLRGLLAPRWTVVAMLAISAGLIVVALLR